MSEFSRASQRLTQAELALDHISVAAREVEEHVNSNTDPYAALQAIEAVHTELQELKLDLEGPLSESANLFSARLREEDRYGPQMVLKVNDFLETFEKCLGACSSVGERVDLVRSTAQIAVSLAEAERVKAEEPDEHAGVAQTQAQEAHKDTHEDEELTIKQREEQLEEMKRQEEIAALANEKRIAKAQAREAQKREAEAARHALQTKANQLNSISRDVETFSKTLTQLIDGITERNALLVCLDTLNDIVSSIVRSPEDERLRTLRLQNPLLQERLTKWEGADVCLCAAGFSARVNTHTDGSLELQLTMEEPVLETPNGLQEWTEWFDRLKAVNQMIQGKKNVIRAGRT